MGILIFDLILGILCLMVESRETGRPEPYEYYADTVSAPRKVTPGEVVCEEEEIAKKIALTFDDDVIIGLSQEISYKEAVSMI